MTHPSKRKGTRVEREVAKGLDTTPGQGDYTDYTVEVKARKGGAGFATLERWMGTADMLFLKRDRAEPLVVMTQRTFLSFLPSHRTCHRQPLSGALDRFPHDLALRVWEDRP